MTDILTSIHGRRMGLDNVGNIVVTHAGISAISGSAFIETGSTSTNMKPYGTTILGSTVATTYTLDVGSMDIGSEKRVVSSGASTTVTLKITNSSTLVTYDNANSKASINFSKEDSAVVLVKLSATRIAIVGQNGTIATAT